MERVMQRQARIRLRLGRREGEGRVRSRWHQKGHADPSPEPCWDRQRQDLPACRPTPRNPGLISTLFSLTTPPGPLARPSRGGCELQGVGMEALGATTCRGKRVSRGSNSTFLEARVRKKCVCWCAAGREVQSAGDRERLFV